MRCIVLIAVAALLASGCGPVTSTGRLVSLDDGVLTTLQMNFSDWGGTMSGIHPVTGEAFTGEYTATADRAVGGVAGAAAWAGSLKGKGAGVLVGDRGTVLDCELEINAGRPPTGHGACTDQHGRRYRLQF